MQKLVPWIIGAAMFAVTPQAFAMQTQTFDFRSGQVNAQWKGIGPIEMQQQAEGIVLRTGAGTGFIVTTTQPKFLGQGISIIASTQDSVDLFFVWVYTSQNGQSYELPFSLEAGASQQETLSMTGDVNWRRGEKQIGIAVPPNTTIRLEAIAIHHWNFLGKGWEAFLSFWHFDSYRPYTINFLWGPQISFTGIDRSQLFAFVPPPYPSGTYIAYGLIVILLGYFGVRSFKKAPGDRKPWFAKRALIVILALWMIFDARMGSEFLSWTVSDIGSYISAPPSIREFRDRSDFYDFAAFAKPLVADRGTYLFFAEQQWPYLGNMRYLTYPSIPGIDIEKDDTWAIYHRPDMVVDSNNQLSIGGEPLTVPGTILGRFDDTSFIFRGAALPTAPLN